MGIIWILPIVWVFLESFNADQGATQNTFFPTKYTANNYVKLFTETDVMNFPRMFLNTFIIAVFVCLISLFFVLSVAFCMSRLRFHFRKTFMNIALILGMFPGIMAVVAIYFILKAMGLTSSSGTLIALIIVYSAGSGAGFYVMKGYMDTIPASLDEAAYLDGCTKWQVFWKIIVPICKPMIVYQAIVGFLAPWLDFVMAGVIARDQHGWTVALGLWNMLQKEYIYQWYTRFAAGAVCLCSASTRKQCQAPSRADIPQDNDRGCRDIYSRTDWTMPAYGSAGGHLLCSRGIPGETGCDV